MLPSRPPEAKTAQPRSNQGRPTTSAPGNFPVVGIGASAGGLEACQKLLDALPAGNGMAFILVQHLDPNHKSILVQLLSEHTTMAVREATDGMPVEPDHLYIIAPGMNLSVGYGALRLTPLTAPHGARRPFDVLLASLAAEFGARAACVILSGTGSDGSAGAQAVKENSGLVIAQDPDEAGYDGMPRSAIMAGAVDFVLPVREIPGALARFAAQVDHLRRSDPAIPTEKNRDALSEIIDLLRSRTSHDFTLYKQGTLRRRIARRMAMVDVPASNIERYLELLRGDQGELDLLAKDLLINVTSFFRDPKVFDYLAEHVIPAMVLNRPADQPIRIWVAGCSTGEETYSLVMLFREQITAANPKIKLQVFASDVDADAVVTAREGLYPHTIEAEVSVERLARFFVREAGGYRFRPDLRSAVVFAVQDVLADPPFSRLDMISCRNLLIYLRSEAQAKVISLFHFALREGGVLLLGGAEAISNPDGRFEPISKQARLYRHIGPSRPYEVSFPVAHAVASGAAMSPAKGQLASRQSALAELCRRLVLDSFAPAAVLINQHQECLFSLGPTDRYLRIAPGHPTFDLPAMARQETRNKLRSAIQQARQRNARVILPGGRITHHGEPVSFSIDVQPLQYDGETLLLICFVDAPKHAPGQPPAMPEEDLPRITELEHELEATRVELNDAIRNLEISAEEQRAINEEALSVNEEFQSTNEELLTSKEELQSLNEELTALNAELHESLDRQRTTSNDLQNVLYSTDVATLFLDAKLNIRFFTPATRSLFHVIPGDLGRPLADLNSLARDSALLTDAQTVLRTREPLEREIETTNGSWYSRRISPYRTQDDGVEGVVITFVDITERRTYADVLETAKRQSERANIAKSRFLAAASHDLRQPLQTLTLLQGLLAKAVDADPARRLVTRLGTTLAAMAGMLNTLLDTNRIEAGTVSATTATFPINTLFSRLKDEFTFHAQARGIDLRVQPCGLTIESDPRLLDQIIRNLLSNALKYTTQGKVLVGCRRHGTMLRIEVWDTGVGIPGDELQAIFEEYHQIANPTHDRNNGLGLGLSIVKRLAELLGHRLNVRSTPGKGSVFTIDVPFRVQEAPPAAGQNRHSVAAPAREEGRRTGAILVVEDDTDVRHLLELSLKAEGHRTATASNGNAAVMLVTQGAIQPDLVLLDYNLPDGPNGLEVADALRKTLHRDVPAIVLTGDITTETMHDIAAKNVTRLNKPVQLKELAETIQRLLPAHAAGVPPQRAVPAAHPPAHPAASPGSDAPVIYIVDDDPEICDTLRLMFEDDGCVVETYLTGEAFFAAYQPGREACLLIDAYLPGMSGFDVLKRLAEARPRLPSIMITGNSDVSMAVEAMKAGAVDFIEKPIGRTELLAVVERALERARDGRKLDEWRDIAAKHIAGLTPRQYEIMTMMLAGHPSKNIAADLNISQRTVENHRAAIMKKTGSKSLPALARLAIAASAAGTQERAAA